MHDNHETQKINQTSVMPEKTGVYWNSRFSIAPMTRGKYDDTYLFANSCP
ncbi:TPA: tRNA-dihydrouridine synthase [Escherichia coli]|nr:tRNA-dihydrouridine synthase [Escherichia coli]